MVCVFVCVWQLLATSLHLVETSHSLHPHPPSSNPFRRAQARANADSIAKAIYSRLFEQMVDVLINSKLKQRNFYRWIGVLDIFGFESFQELEVDLRVFFL